MFSKRTASEIRRLPFFPVIPIVPILFMASEIGLTIAVLRRLRKLEAQLGANHAETCLSERACEHREALHAHGEFQAT